MPMQVMLDSSILESLLQRAASAARRVGHIDDGVFTAVGPLADDIDRIVHTLTELLGSPLIAAHDTGDGSTSAGGGAAREAAGTRAGALTFGVAAGGAR